MNTEDVYETEEYLFDDGLDDEAAERAKKMEHKLRKDFNREGGTF